MFEISRRDLVLGSTGAALVFGLKGPVSFIGAAHAQRAADSLKYKVGDIEVFSLNDGTIERTVTEGMVKNASLDDVKADCCIVDNISPRPGPHGIAVSAQVILFAPLRPAMAGTGCRRLRRQHAAGLELFPMIEEYA